VMLGMLAARTCVNFFSLIFHSKMKKLQSPIIFMICLMSLYGSIALYLSYWVYLGPFARIVCGIVVIVWSYYYGFDTYLFLSFDTEKDRTIPKVIFMLSLMRPSCFISLYLPFWVCHSSIPGKSEAW
jgi:uncharacterized membrane protein YfcA